MPQPTVQAQTVSQALKAYRLARADATLALAGYENALIAGDAAAIKTALADWRRKAQARREAIANLSEACGLHSIVRRSGRKAA